MRIVAGGAVHVDRSTDSPTSGVRVPATVGTSIAVARSSRRRRRPTTTACTIVRRRRSALTLERLEAAAVKRCMHRWYRRAALVDAVLHVGVGALAGGVVARVAELVHLVAVADEQRAVLRRPLVGPLMVDDRGVSAVTTGARIGVGHVVAVDREVRERDGRNQRARAPRRQPARRESSSSSRYTSLLHLVVRLRARRADRAARPPMTSVGQKRPSAHRWSRSPASGAMWSSTNGSAFGGASRSSAPPEHRAVAEPVTLDAVAWLARRRTVGRSHR